jgi:hypothetical protein
MWWLLAGVVIGGIASPAILLWLIHTDTDAAFKAPRTRERQRYRITPLA